MGGGAERISGFFIFLDPFSPGTEHDWITTIISMMPTAPTQPLLTSQRQSQTPPTKSKSLAINQLKTPNILNLLLVGATLSLVSCTSSNLIQLDYQGYQKTPNKMSAKITRALCKSNPYTAKRGFYGKWGGSGNLGGKPVDQMDELFRRHDLVYYLCRCKKNLSAADEALVERLENLNPETLAPKEDKFRMRAISFMSSRWASFLGKPVCTSFYQREISGSYFDSPEDVHAFFEPDHSGIPMTDSTSAVAVPTSKPELSP